MNSASIFSYYLIPILVFSIAYSSFHLFKPDFDYLLPLRLPYFASLRETKTVVHLPEIRCNV
jgi:hypothetical protein